MTSSLARLTDDDTSQSGKADEVAHGLRHRVVHDEHVVLVVVIEVDVEDFVVVVLLDELVPLDGRDDIAESVDIQVLVVVDVVAIVVRSL